MCYNKALSAFIYPLVCDEHRQTNTYNTDNAIENKVDTENMVNTENMVEIRNIDRQPDAVHNGVQDEDDSEINEMEYFNDADGEDMLYVESTVGNLDEEAYQDNSCNWEYEYNKVDEGTDGNCEGNMVDSLLKEDTDEDCDKDCAKGCEDYAEEVGNAHPINIANESGENAETAGDVRDLEAQNEGKDNGEEDNEGDDAVVYSLDDAVTPFNNGEEDLEEETQSVEAYDTADNSALLQMCFKMKKDQICQYKLVLFLHAMKFKLTHACYAEMVNLLHPSIPLGMVWSMRTHAGAPARLQMLINHVFQTISAFLPIQTLPIELESGCHTTPYLTFKTVLFIWTSSPAILASLEDSHKHYTHPFLSATSTLQTLSARIKVMELYCSTFGVERAETCVQHLDILQRTLEYWNPKYQANLKLPPSIKKHVLFIRFRIYNDDFGWMGIVKNTKGNCLGCVTDPSIDPGLRASPGGLANLPLFLTSTLAVKQYGLNELLDLYTKELQELAKGVIINVGQQTFLIFAYTYDFIGDEPARAHAMGLSASVNTALPCLKCITPKVSFADVAKNPINLQPNRKSSSVQMLLSANGGEHGSIVGPNRTIAAAMGIECISKPSLFKEMSQRFSAYVKQNHIPAEYSFHDEQSIKGLHRYGLKEFYMVSPWILLSLGAIHHSDTILRREFKYWCCHMRIVAILCMHSIPVNVYQELSQHIQTLLEYLGNIHPTEITYNVHLYHHVKENTFNFALFD
ncbi:hypothetical protein HDU80_011711, partial [Chytriomyces hyalinus]